MMIDGVRVLILERIAAAAGPTDLLRGECSFIFTPLIASTENFMEWFESGATG